jgi:four helix bundle protein
VADQRLRDQIRDASDSMLSNIAEGFEQPTDRAFARYLYISKGSTAELRTRLYRARTGVTSPKTSTNPAKRWRTKSVGC